MKSTSEAKLAEAKLAAAAVLVAIGITGSTAAVHASSGAKDKCYGIVKAGQNDCADALGVHSCAGQARVDYAPTEWKYVAKGNCASEGGKTTPPAK